MTFSNISNTNVDSTNAHISTLLENLHNKFKCRRKSAFDRFIEKYENAEKSVVIDIRTDKVVEVPEECTFNSSIGIPGEMLPELSREENKLLSTAFDIVRSLKSHTDETPVTVTTYKKSVSSCRNVKLKRIETQKIPKRIVPKRVTVQKKLTVEPAQGTASKRSKRLRQCRYCESNSEDSDFEDSLSTSVRRRLGILENKSNKKNDDKLADSGQGSESSNCSNPYSSFVKTRTNRVVVLKRLTNAKVSFSQQRAKVLSGDTHSKKSQPQNNSRPKSIPLRRQPHRACKNSSVPALKCKENSDDLFKKYKDEYSLKDCKVPCIVPFNNESLRERTKVLNINVQKVACKTHFTRLRTQHIRENTKIDANNNVSSNKESTSSGTLKHSMVNKRTTTKVSCTTLSRSFTKKKWTSFATLHSELSSMCNSNFSFLGLTNSFVTIPSVGNSSSLLPANLSMNVSKRSSNLRSLCSGKAQRLLNMSRRSNDCSIML